TLASAGADNTVRLWNIATPTTSSMTHILYGHSDMVWSVAWSPDGKQLATASADQTVRLWDAQSGQMLYLLTGYTDRVSSVAWSPDGKQLATASADGKLLLWDPFHLQSASWLPKQS